MFFQSVIARRYARGLLKEAGTNKESIGEELQNLADLFVKSDDFRNLIVNPAFSPLERSRIIDKLNEKSPMHHSLVNFLKLLIDKSRMSLLKEINDAYALLLDESLNRVRVNIRSAFPLTVEERENICSMLAKMTHQNVLATEQTDKDLLSGVRVELPSTVIDSSLQARLDSLRSQLMDLRL